MKAVKAGAVQPEVANLEPASERERLRRKRIRRARTIALIRLGIVATVLGLWEYASGRWLEPFIFSSPSMVWARLVEMATDGTLWNHIRVTFTEIGVGYPIGSLLGLTTGYLFGRNKTLADIFEPIIVAIYGVPRTALAPLFIIWLGIGIASKVGIVILMTFFLTFFNTYSGMKTMDQDYLRLARLMGAKESMITWRVILPSIFPSVLVGLKTSVPQSVIGATVGEFIASTAGLGYLIRRSAQLFDAGALFVGVLALLIIVLVLNNVLDRLEGVVMRWRPVAEERVRT